MGWGIGYDENWQRDIGYCVPALCDQPECTEEIDRGLSHVCGSEPYGGEHGCGLYFCEPHLRWNGKGEERVCARCHDAQPPYEKKPDVRAWIEWKLTDASWQRWRDENPSDVAILRSEVR